MAPAEAKIILFISVAKTDKVPGKLRFILILKGSSP